MAELRDLTQRLRTFFHQSAGAVVLSDDRCLVIRRADRDEWILPKGHLEEGESPENAAVREVREETGLEVRILEYVGDTRYWFGPGLGHRKRVDWFLAEHVGGELNLESIFGEAAFLDEREAAAVLTHEADRSIVERAFAIARARASRGRA